MANRRDFLKGAAAACLGGGLLFGGKKAPGVVKEAVEYQGAQMAVAPANPDAKFAPLPTVNPRGLPDLSTLTTDELAKAIEVPMRTNMGGIDHTNKNFSEWTPFNTWNVGTGGSGVRWAPDLKEEFEYNGKKYEGSGNYFILQGYHPDGCDVAVPSMEFIHSVKWRLNYVRENRWDVIGRGIQTLDDVVRRDIWTQQWEVITAAGHDRNMVVYDHKEEEDGRFSPRLNSLMKTVMRRNGGGNSTSIRRGRMTDLVMGRWAYDEAFGVKGYITQECQKDPKLDRWLQFYYDFDKVELSGVTIRPNSELDPGGRLYKLYTDELCGMSFPEGKKNLVIGIDSQHCDTFATLIHDDHQLKVYETPNLRGYAGVTAVVEAGIVCVDNRGVLLGAF